MAKKSSKKSSGKKDKEQKSKINEKDKKFIITLISVLVILSLAVLTIYHHSGYNENKMVQCPEGSNQADVCTTEYDPVCGYDSEGNRLETYSNDCHACKNESVSQFTRGECSNES